LECDKETLKRSFLSKAERFSCEIMGEAHEQLRETLLTFLTDYSQQNPSKIPLPLNALSPFRANVLHRLQQVPFGSFITYGQLALESGYPGAARAVGTACHLNPFPLFIPCHRVIASGGKIGGFAYDLELKERLLAFEENK
jgi:O-6-methylguanine DNA methyltransferase